MRSSLTSRSPTSGIAELRLRSADLRLRSAALIARAHAARRRLHELRVQGMAQDDLQMSILREEPRRFLDGPALRAPMGATVENGGVRFRVWAQHDEVEVVWTLPDGSTCAQRLERNDESVFSGWIHGPGAGTRYHYRLDGRLLPDPASRWQPEGVHGPSMVVDPRSFRWTDDAWAGLSWRDLVVYELHVGTFSRAGTFAGVQDRLAYLANLGVTAIELMPIAEFAGRRNWGYDGVDLFAPSHTYGTPEDLRRLVDAAHAAGLGIIVDVVYNHLGPDGAYLAAFAPAYFTDRHKTPWGNAVNLDGPGSRHVREFLIQNALHWLDEYHVDGLRLDATHELKDESGTPFLAELSAALRAYRPNVVLIAEDERNESAVAQPLAAGGFGIGALWADDFHHHVRRHVAGDAEGYFASYSGSADAIARTIADGWFYSGQVAPHTGAPRGTDPHPLAYEQFVFCIQNHDQIGNRARGDRLHHRVDPATYRAVSALLLLAPETPLLFMGQEWAASTPFAYFTDHEEPLGQAITEGRRAEFARFSAFADPARREAIPDPQAETTFTRSRLDWAEMDAGDHGVVLRLYTALLALRRASRLSPEAGRAAADAIALDEHTVAIRRSPEGAPPILAVIRLNGAGIVGVPSAFSSNSDKGCARSWRAVLTTEDRGFAVDGTPPHVRVENGTLLIEFARPGAVVLRDGG